MNFSKNMAEMLHKKNFWIFLIIIAFASYLGRDIILFNAVAAKIKIMLGIYNIEIYGERDYTKMKNMKLHANLDLQLQGIMDA